MVFELDKDEQLGYQMITKRPKLTFSTPDNGLSIPNSVLPQTELFVRRSNLVKYCGKNLKSSNRLVGEYERKFSLVARVSKIKDPSGEMPTRPSIYPRTASKRKQSI